MVLLFLVAVTLLITRSFDGGSGGGVDGRSETTAGGRSTTSGDPALAELRERYARGEIDDEEFERRSSNSAAQPTPRNDGDSPSKRRTFLESIAGLGVVSLAGCVSGVLPTDGENDQERQDTTGGEVTPRPPPSGPADENVQLTAEQGDDSARRGFQFGDGDVAVRRDSPGPEPGFGRATYYRRT